MLRKCKGIKTHKYTQVLHFMPKNKVFQLKLKCLLYTARGKTRVNYHAAHNIHSFCGGFNLSPMVFLKPEKNSFGQKYF